MNLSGRLFAQTAGSDLTGVAGWVTDIIDRLAAFGGGILPWWPKGRIAPMASSA